MSDPIGLMGGNDPRYQRVLGSQDASSGGGVEGSHPPTRSFHGFDRERATYERLKPVLLEQAPGQFVAVVGDDYAGPADTFDHAECRGYSQFGIGPLYIKQILAEEPAEEVSRDIGS